MIANYKNNFDWIKIIKLLQKNKNVELSFLWKNEILYKRKISDQISSFTFKKMCVSRTIVKNIFVMIHDDFDEHIEFDRIYNKIVNFWYIKNHFKHFTNYFKHCSQRCGNRIRRHKFYHTFQSILSLLIFFHCIIIDFLLILSNFHIDMNNIMSIIDKFNKRIIIISSKNIWNTTQWIEALLNRFNLTD